jgi:hypothetical protein
MPARAAKRRAISTIRSSKPNTNSASSSLFPHDRLKTPHSLFLVYQIDSPDPSSHSFERVRKVFLFSFAQSILPGPSTRRTNNTNDSLFLAIYFRRYIILEPFQRLDLHAFLYERELINTPYPFQPQPRLPHSLPTGLRPSTTYVPRPLESRSATCPHSRRRTR